ncbi:MAG: two-component sensor histidine kinase [Bradyrhizobium sp.]|nr:two-component sensor histidine kinase [Bradyrhizobium sp.]
MIRFKSILSRIVVLHVIAVAITSVLMSVALSWLLTVAANEIHNEAMEEQAQAIARQLALEPDGRLSLQLPPDLQGLYSQPYGRYSYAVVDDHGNALFSSLRDRGPIFSVNPRDPPVHFIEQRRAEAPISGASLRRVIGPHTVYVQAGEDLSNRDVLTDDIVADFYKNVGWITLPILLVLLVVDIAIFRRALFPLKAASEIAQQIGPARTDVRLPVGGIPGEVLPLVRAINQALDRLDQGFRSQREFTADAAHELRTPLSVLRARIDMLDGQGDAISHLKADIEAMGRIVGQLLDIAELDAIHLDPAEKADLRGACAEVLESVAPLAIQSGREIALQGASGPVWVHGNAEMIKRAIRNLADNAIKHTPPHTAIEFSVDKNGSLTVRDHGPGIAVEDQEHIFRRFWRRDRGKPASTGLGLSIVNRIVELHGGSIKIVNGPDRGAQFLIQLRPAEAPGKAEADAVGRGTEDA